LENEGPKEEIKDEVAERRQALESKRNALLTRLKKLDAQGNYKSYEAKALRTILKDKVRIDTRALRRKLNYLDFKVQTEATTLQLERQLMKEIKKTQREIDDAATDEKQFRKLSYLESDIRECEKEMNQLEHELQETNKEISELDTMSREESKKRASEERAKKRMGEREKKRKETHEAVKKEEEPFMTKLEPTVTLEDICVIKKKEGKSKTDEEE
jgi:uncharacterized coiled-coil DUF342 family protein